VREGRKQNPKSSQLAALDGTLCVRLGEIERDRGRVGAALARFREAVAVDPTNAPAWNALGMTLGGNGNLAEAEQAFRSAIARDSSDHRYFFNLGLALARQGRAGDARPYFEKALQLAPGFEPAREELQKLAANAGR
jgi:Flp pilus assembly protein TadD